ncbi:MAG: hypothetical protein R3F43_12235 [bacterium]
MALFGGDAFRSGTHKALIYTWLRAQGREAERTRVYGFTRSWSKIGSAVSFAGRRPGLSGSYSSIFLYSALPALANLVNQATYPAWLDGERPAGGDRFGFSVLRAGLADVVRRRPLRRLIGQSLAVEGSYEVAKDYLQPVLQRCSGDPVGLAFRRGSGARRCCGRARVCGPVLPGELRVAAVHAWKPGGDTGCRRRCSSGCRRWLTPVTAGLLLGQPGAAIWCSWPWPSSRTCGDPSMWPLRPAHRTRPTPPPRSASSPRRRQGRLALWALTVGASDRSPARCRSRPAGQRSAAALLGCRWTLLSIRRRRSCCECVKARPRSMEWRCIHARRDRDAGARTRARPGAAGWRPTTTRSARSVAATAFRPISYLDAAEERSASAGIDERQASRGPCAAPRPGGREGGFNGFTRVGAAASIAAGKMTEAAAARCRIPIPPPRDPADIEASLKADAATWEAWCRFPAVSPRPRQQCRGPAQA